MEIGWNLWGMLPHLLPQPSRRVLTEVDEAARPTPR